MPTINPNLPSNTASVPAATSEGTGQIDKAPPKATVAKAQQEKDKLVAQRAQPKVPGAASSAMTAAPLATTDAPAVSDVMSIFSALEPLVGEPSGELASGFQPHGLDEIASWKLPLASDTAADLLSTGEGPATAMTERLQLLHHARQLVGHAIADPKAAAEATKSKLALPVQKIFEAAMPQIIAQLKATMGSPFPKKKGETFDGTAATAHEEIEIPSGEMVKLEQTLAKPMAAAHAALKGLGLSTSNDTAAAQAATQPVYSLESPVDKAMTQSGGLPAGMDIDALVQMVLMEAAQGGDDDLRSRISDLEATNQQQEQMRNTIAAQQAQDAASKTLLQNEYNRRCDLPTTDPAYINATAVTFQDFSSTQQLVQTPTATFDINGYPTNSPTYSLSPNMTYYPPATGEQAEDGTPIPQTVVDQAAQLDVSPQNLFALEQRYASDSSLTSEFPTFSAFLLTPAAQGGVGLSFTQGSPQTTPQDAAVLAWMQNNQAPTQQSGGVGAYGTTYSISTKQAQALVDYYNAMSQYYGNHPPTPSGWPTTCDAFMTDPTYGPNLKTPAPSGGQGSAVDGFFAKLKTATAAGENSDPVSRAADIFAEQTAAQACANLSENDSSNTYNAQGEENDIDAFEKDFLGDATQAPLSQLDDFIKQIVKYNYPFSNNQQYADADLATAIAGLKSLMGKAPFNTPPLQQEVQNYVGMRLQQAQNQCSWLSTNLNVQGYDDDNPGDAQSDGGVQQIVSDPSFFSTPYINMTMGMWGEMGNNLNKMISDPTLCSTDPSNIPLPGAGLGDPTVAGIVNGYGVRKFAAGQVMVGNRAAVLWLDPGDGGGSGGGTNSTNDTNDTGNNPSNSGPGDGSGDATDPATALAANITVLETPVDHSVQQPDQQEVSGSQMTEAQLAANITAMQGQMDSLGDMSEQQQIEIQLAQSRSSKYYEMLSNVMKSVSDTQSAIVANMKD